MENKKLQAGFAPFLVLIIVAALAVGGGVYVSKKKQAKVETSAEVNAGAETADAGQASGNSLSALLDSGKDLVCKFSTSVAGINNTSTVYISHDGNMRAEIQSESSGGIQTANTLYKDGYSYVWNAESAHKIKVDRKDINDSLGAVFDQKEDLANLPPEMGADADYSCSDWTIDNSKFILPAGIEFQDLDKLIQDALESKNIDVNSKVKLGQ